MRAICAELGIDRLAMWGTSGGGPHVLACAALMPDLVAAAASLASLAPVDADGLDWLAGMGQLNVDDFLLYQRDPAAARAKLEADREMVLSATPAEEEDEIESLLSPTDKAILEAGFGEYFYYVEHEGLAPGVEGWWDDGVARASTWGFELSAISVPVLLMHGRHDQFVPFGHGQWLAGHIPGVEARLLDEDGHLTLEVNRVPEVHAWLADRL